MKRIIALSIAMGFLAGIFAGPVSVLAQDQDKVELKLQLPKPMFIGTPRNLTSPNLERITGKPRGAFFVPAGTKLVSLNMPVSASDMQPVIGEVAYVTDGEKAGEDGYVVEFGPGTQYVQVDLNAEKISFEAVFTCTQGLIQGSGLLWVDIESLISAGRQVSDISHLETVPGGL